MHSSMNDGGQLPEPDLLYARHHSNDEQQSQEKQQQQPCSPGTASTVELDLPTIIATLEENINKLQQSISVVVDKKAVSHGVWDADLKLVKVIEHKHLKQYQPHMLNGSFYLYPFEALFALECRVLAILFQDIPLSIEDGYRLLLRDKQDIKLYQVFSTLSKSGYHVKRHTAAKEAAGRSTLKGEPSQANSKHLLGEDAETCNDGDKAAKRLKQDESNSKTSVNNYKAVTSIRALSVRHLKKFTKVDEKMRSYFKLTDDGPSSILYCVRDSAVPLEMNKRLQHLHGEGDLKPLVDFSAIYSSEQLFSRMQQAGPKCHLSQPDELSGDLNLSVEFDVFSSNRSSSQSSEPLFRVAVIFNEDDEIPPMSVMRRLQGECSAPLLFALSSDSLEFNFFAVEHLAIGNEYPTLWEKYYAVDSSMVGHHQ